MRRIHDLYEIDTLEALIILTKMLGAGDLMREKSSMRPTSSEIDGIRATLGVTLTMNLVAK